MGSISDLSSDDEELNQAIIASLESHETSPQPNTLSAQEVLLNLASQIESKQKCRFNINRSSVLDGAVQGFRRVSYNPKYQMCIKFSDDLGMDEEAVDLGGPRREFLRLLMEALPLSPMFEGRNNKLNLALDSSALREDRYVFAGRAIAVSLVHGGPPPGFIAPTLYTHLVGGNSTVKPVLEDIADADLFEKRCLIVGLWMVLYKPLTH
nr:G2/M phase-specific E3 ubiquitin-protein ligase-like [Paramormyrops kingsleyae]